MKSYHAMLLMSGGASKVVQHKENKRHLALQRQTPLNGSQISDLVPSWSQSHSWQYGKL